MNVTSTADRKKKIIKKRKEKIGNLESDQLQTNKNIWIKLLGETKYNQLKEMNNSDISITRWQKQRVMRALFLLPVILGLYAISKSWEIVVLGVIIMAVTYIMDARSINNKYIQYKFERHLEFTKFQRIVVPYLMKRNENNNLWSIFNKIIDRLKYESDKLLLMVLMNDMVEKPHDIEPFDTFAKNMSNTDNSHLFMGTIFDIREGSADMDVITELDRLASEELMDGINSIIDYKSSKFRLFSTKLTMPIFIPMAGYFAGFLLRTLKDFNFIN